jgi:two-component system sensor histidine kinase PilS (NtrC family)
VEAAGGEEPRAAAQGSVPLLRRAGSHEQRLVVLMGARLALALLSLGIALAVEMALGAAGADGQRGLYGTVAFSFVATALYGALLPRIRRHRRFAAASIAIDIAVVSALVHFSGGRDSVFAFLYLLVAAYGALLFDRGGALVTAGLGGLAYGAVLLLAGAADGGAERNHPTVLFAVWAVHASAIALVAALASFLAAELRRTGEALRQRTSDLRDLEHLHRRTVESLMSGLLTTDTRGCVTSFNPEAERITGRTAGWALGRDVEEVVPGVRALVGAKASGAGTLGRARMRFRASGGAELHLGIAAYILRDAEGAPSGHVVIFQDVTEVVAMEEDLRRSERLAAVGELSASIAHEIRNPLAALSGAIQVLGRAAPPAGAPAEARRLMDIALRETDRLNRLITDFLRYARPGPLALEAVALRGCIGELLAVLGPSVPAGVQIAVEVPEGLGVRADPAQLRQVLWNLALNACQAMPAGGRITLAAAPLAAPAPQDAPGAGRNPREEPGRARPAQPVAGEAKRNLVELSIRDEGVGIAPEQLERVFDPFFTTRPDGTGLGLATVHRIIQEHGGSIRVESQVGKGTTFRIRLPRAEVSQ